VSLRVGNLWQDGLRQKWDLNLRSRTTENLLLNWRITSPPETCSTIIRTKQLLSMLKYPHYPRYDWEIGNDTNSWVSVRACMGHVTWIRIYVVWCCSDVTRSARPSGQPLTIASVMHMKYYHNDGPWSGERDVRRTILDVLSVQSWHCRLRRLPAGALRTADWCCRCYRTSDAEQPIHTYTTPTRLNSTQLLSQRFQRKRW